LKHPFSGAAARSSHLTAAATASATAKQCQRSCLGQPASPPGAMDWFSSAINAGAGAVAALSERLEEEKREFMASAALHRYGIALLNPLDDPDSGVKARASNSMLMLPWEAPGLSPEVRARMRSLSSDRSTFLSPPADDGSFRFDMAESVPLVLEALSVDKHLEKQRHLLVPQQISEEAFFRNYFWHLHAISLSPVPSESGDSSLASGDSSSSPLVVNVSSSSDGTEVAAASSTPLEEQFESLSEELFANAVASKLRSPSDAVRLPPDVAEEAEAPAPRESDQIGVSADSLVSDWEAELRAEIEGLGAAPT